MPCFQGAGGKNPLLQWETTGRPNQIRAALTCAVCAKQYILGRFANRMNQGFERDQKGRSRD